MCTGGLALHFATECVLLSTCFPSTSEMICVQAGAAGFQDGGKQSKNRGCALICSLREATDFRRYNPPPSTMLLDQIYWQTKWRNHFGVRLSICEKSLPQNWLRKKEAASAYMVSLPQVLQSQDILHSSLRNVSSLPDLTACCHDVRTTST